MAPQQPFCKANRAGSGLGWAVLWQFYFLSMKSADGCKMHHPEKFTFFLKKSPPPTTKVSSSCDGYSIIYLYGAIAVWGVMQRTEHGAGPNSKDSTNRGRGQAKSAYWSSQAKSRTTKASQKGAS